MLSIIYWIAIIFFIISLLIIVIPITAFFLACILTPSSSFPDLE